MKRNGDRRVVVTGLGLVTPLGTGLEKNWEALMAGRSGIVAITRSDVSDFATRIGGEVHDFNPLIGSKRSDVKKMDLFIQYAIAAAQQATQQSGLKIGDYNAERVGVLMGNGIGGLLTLEENHLLYLDTRLKRISPFCIPNSPNLPRPNSDPLRRARRQPDYHKRLFLRQPCGGRGVSDDSPRLPHAAIAGGSEAALTALGVGGFAAMRALFDPQRRATGSQPPVRRRARRLRNRRRGWRPDSGGARSRLAPGRKHPCRGRRLRANRDAYHMTSPSPGGQGAARCMRLRWKTASSIPAKLTTSMRTARRRRRAMSRRPKRSSLGLASAHSRSR